MPFLRGEGLTRLSGIPRLARAYRRWGAEQNFRALPDGNTQSNEIFRLFDGQSFVVFLLRF
jgi:hypothetical protein